MYKKHSKKTEDPDFKTADFYLFENREIFEYTVASTDKTTFYRNQLARAPSLVESSLREKKKTNITEGFLP